MRETWRCSCCGLVSSAKTVREAKVLVVVTSQPSAANSSRAPVVWKVAAQEGMPKQSNGPAEGCAGADERLRKQGSKIDEGEDDSG